MTTFFRLLRDNLVHGDQARLAKKLGKNPSRVNLWTKPPACEDGPGQPSPVDFYFRFIEAVRSTANVEGADRIHQAINEELGFVAYKKTAGYSDDADFAQLLGRFSEVVDERARAESPDSPGGRIRTPDERRAIANDALVLAGAALKYADDQNTLADAEECQPIRRRA